MVEIAAALDIDVADVVLALDASVAARAEPLEAQNDVSAATTEFDRVDAAVVAPQLLDQLGEEERRVVELRFFEAMTQSEIAVIVGVSQMQVSRVLQRALRRLRTALDDTT